ncbi:MAG: hypothetical protein IJK81_01295 [Selenomonadaceae bacterium]|nr:hypothetical protein [Selenomonadaceae bacterium]
MSNVGDFIKCLAGYFAMMFIFTWIAEKLFGSFDLIGFYIADGHILKGLFLAVLAYIIYFTCAGVTASIGNSGKAVVAVVVAFSLFGMYHEINELAGNKEGINYVGSVLFYLIAMLNDTLRIVATLHAFKGEM